MTKAEPIFRTVGQALYVAYVVEVTPLTQKGGTQIVVEDMMRRGGYQSESRTRTEQSISLGTMTPLEFRAQCAVIRQAVDKLDAPHRHAVKARYGRQQTRSEAVAGLVELIGALCNSRNQEAVKALIWSIYSASDGQDWSLRRIEREYGVGINTLRRDQQLMRKLTTRWLSLGELKLEGDFERAGVIGEPAA